MNAESNFRFAKQIQGFNRNVKLSDELWNGRTRLKRIYITCLEYHSRLLPLLIILGKRGLFCFVFWEWSEKIRDCYQQKKSCHIVLLSLDCHHLAFTDAYRNFTHDFPQNTSANPDSFCNKNCCHNTTKTKRRREPKQKQIFRQTIIQSEGLPQIFWVFGKLRADRSLWRWNISASAFQPVLQSIHVSFSRQAKDNVITGPSKVTHNPKFIRKQKSLENVHSRYIYPVVTLGQLISTVPHVPFLASSYSQT